MRGVIRMDDKEFQLKTQKKKWETVQQQYDASLKKKEAELKIIDKQNQARLVDRRLKYLEQLQKINEKFDVKETIEALINKLNEELI